MADLTPMISSSDPKPTPIDSLVKADQATRSGSERDLFLNYYQRFTGELCTEMLWRVPTSSKHRQRWRDRGRDLVIEIIVKLIR